MLITLARKPLGGATVIQTCLTYGTGALNIDPCRIPTSDKLSGGHAMAGQQMTDGWHRPWMDDPVAANAARSRDAVKKAESLGRWPANVLHDGSDAVLMGFPHTGSTKARVELKFGRKDESEYRIKPVPGVLKDFGDSGSAARFFKQVKGC